MEKSYHYLLSIYDSETGEDAGVIEALSLKELQDKLERVPEIVKNYEEKLKELDGEEDEFDYNEVDLNADAERHND